MKAASTLVLVSTQLALSFYTAFSLPLLQVSEYQALSLFPTSEIYPIAKGQDSLNQGGEQWQKRGQTNLAEHPKTKLLEGGTSSSSHEQHDLRDYNNNNDHEEEDDANDPRALSAAEFHGKAFAFNSKQAGKELFNGPVRAVTEMPISGVIGAVHHTGVACNYAAHCDIKKAGKHVLSGVGKLTLGLSGSPAYLAVGGIAHSGPPLVRATEHLAKWTGNGVKEGYDRVVHGKQPQRSLHCQESLEKMKKDYPTHMSKDAREHGYLLRSAEWNGPDETGRPIKSSTRGQFSEKGIAGSQQHTESGHCLAAGCFESAIAGSIL